MQVKINVDEVNKINSVVKSLKPQFKIIKHYNLFKDLFAYNYFFPLVDLNIVYDKNTPVFYGNKMKVSQVNKIWT